MIMEANDNAPTETFRYVDVVDFPHIGQIPAQAALESPYDRLPMALKDSIRTDLWNLGKNSAGVAVRFRTDSKKLKARWEVLNDFSMNHMTPVGIKGLDLYTLDNGRWYFVGSARPGLRKGPHESTFISNLDGTMRDYILYMPLYDSAQKVEIGILDDAVIDQPSNEFPPQSKPVVVYGTSLTQGGCANRPGMVYTSILSRWMNREFINLGFSGNGRLDYEIAELMGQSDAGLFILDHLPNCTIDKLDRLPRFVEILRVNHPNTPILLLGNARYTYDRFNTVSRGETIAKNNRLVEIYEKLKQNDPNIYYLPSDELVGEDEEATVDGTHFSDLGFMRMSENLLPVLQRILGE
ncbi:MAG: SGNH/GDSL hydrolase family protein [Muribaculaceae bacterium]|nr:SGNH/GDSL hydrolase family protein [Muribaculaceae bacterium]